MMLPTVKTQLWCAFVYSAQTVFGEENVEKKFLDVKLKKKIWRKIQRVASLAPFQIPYMSYLHG